MDPREFLRELSELTKKHGISIGACGCCGSPFLTELEGDDDHIGAYIVTDEPDNGVKWICKGDELDWEEYGHLVKDVK